MSEERYLTFALGKGRLAKKTLELFEQIGITCEEMKDKDTRKLIFVDVYKRQQYWHSKSGERVHQKRSGDSKRPDNQKAGDKSQ